MSASDVQREILDPMQRLFLPPRRLEPGEEQAVLREYVRPLESYDADILRLAWQDIVETHGSRSWPLPSAVIKAAKEAARDRRLLSQPKINHDGPAPKTEAEQKWDRWVAICRTEMAREAVRRGVAWSLKCEILDNGKLPEQIDLRALVIAKSSAERTAAHIEDGTLKFAPHTRSAALGLWQAQLTRESQTQDEINYGKAA